ncbi:MAG TPA: DUF503 domain-containing protein [Polyangiaceae bacterium]|jgi:uncharacterized protein YlxP (DUF503 family)|nr:DUF503 domain-containing protein [Polyangiaceae bacterium]
MFVGVARFVLQIPGARSLKDRRRVVKSFKDRLRSRLPVAVAEVGDLERYQVATVAVSAISNDSARCSETLSAATGMARSVADAVLADVATEIVSFGHGGSGIRGGIENVLDEIERARGEEES